MVHLQIMIKLGDGLSLPYHKLSKLGAHLVIVYSCCSYFWQLEESLLYLIKLMVKGCLVGSISGFPIYYHLCPKKNKLKSHSRRITEIYAIFKNLKFNYTSVKRKKKLERGNGANVFISLFNRPSQFLDTSHTIFKYDLN